QVSVPSVRCAGDKFDHIDRMIAKISGHLDQAPADLVVLPELCTIEYSRQSFECLAELAEDLDGPAMEKMRALATSYQTAVVFGMPRRDDGEYFISQIAIGADGDLLACYDKLHICHYGASMEKEFFQRGQAVCVFSVAGFRFSPIICYDIRFPELSRSLALDEEVDCILHCGAYYRDESFASWHSFATTRALENQLYFLSLNRAGELYGDSIFCLPWMDEQQVAVRFATHDEDFRYLKIERSKIEAAREQYTFLKDRLTDYRRR
ncbi:MAG: carbon-nitrogen hydrolase family protein, partial [Gammaproteobacteria bacterium]